MSINLYSKLIGCNVHNSIRINPMALKIIGTPEFQRMKNIKQLGLCHYVYPAATHTRFEHSIGTYHLAGIMLEKIQQKYPDNEYFIPELANNSDSSNISNKIKLTDKIIECIKIGALCHDIGHGPFSHIFDDVLLKDSNHPNRCHEERSCLIIEMLCKRELADELNQNDIQFIKSIINPKDQHYGALYQIVTNNLNGIDVDKFDYLARDTKNLGLTTGFNAYRLINEFIIDKNGNIAYPKHCSFDIYELFHSRYMMHKKVYSHKTVKLIELMLQDIFLKVDSVFKISDSINDMKNFCKLTDNTIFYYIDNIINPPPFIQINMPVDEYNSIATASEIYQRIISRNLYQQILEITNDNTAEKYINDFLNYLMTKTEIFKPETCTREDFYIIKTEIGFVSGNKPDPFDSIYFYDKKEDNNTFIIDKTLISGLVGNKIQETKWHFICKKRSLYHLVMTELKKYDIMVSKIKI